MRVVCSLFQHHSKQSPLDRLPLHAAAYETPTSVHVTKMHKHYYGQLEVIIMVRYAIGIRQYSGCHVSIK